MASHPTLRRVSPTLVPLSAGVLLSGCHDLDNFLQACMRDADFL